jgi:Flp pilus assembly protein TadG
MRLTTRRGSTDRRRSRGQALVEFAFTFPIFILIVLGVIEGGAFAFTYASLQHAAEAGGRLAALPATATATGDRIGDPCAPPSDDARVRACVVARAVAVSLTEGMVAVSATGVTVTYPYQPLTSMVFGAGVTFNLSAETEYVPE